MKNVVIIVPIYKTVINQFEKISLRQLFSVLGDFPIALVEPRGFDPEYVELHDREYSLVYFPEEYFESTESYSRLLLSEGFYDQFSEYEYMLIYQLDCFVFQNRLQKFCDMGFDYIGASIYQSDGFWNKYHVGNGGFSLRKIRKCKEMLSYSEEFLNNCEFSERIKHSEDAFFSYCCAEDRYDFAGAPPDVADSFSLLPDTESKKRWILENGLPFGFHYFPTYYYDFWNPFIRLCGYDLPMSASDIKDSTYLLLMNQWMILKSNGVNLVTFLNRCNMRKIAIYGMSVYARHLVRELDGSDVKICFGLDRRNLKSFHSIKAYMPSESPDEPVDAIINTVVWDHNNIKKSLRKYFECDIISLEDIVFSDIWSDSI